MEIKRFMYCYTRTNKYTGMARSKLCLTDGADNQEKSKRGLKQF